MADLIDLVGFTRLETRRGSFDRWSITVAAQAGGRRRSRRRDVDTDRRDCGTVGACLHGRSIPLRIFAYRSARGSRGTLVGSGRAVGLINATQRVSSGARRAVAIMDWPQYGSHTHTSISWLTMAFATA